MDKQPTQSEQAGTAGQSTAPSVSPATAARLLQPSKKVYDYSKQSRPSSPQARLALKALQDHPKGITTRELQREPYNICHPPARMLDLKSCGYRVVGIPQEHLNGMALWVVMSGSEVPA